MERLICLGAIAACFPHRLSFLSPALSDAASQTEPGKPMPVCALQTYNTCTLSLRCHAE